MDLNKDDLGLDEAYLKVISNHSDPVYLYELSGDCDGCPYQKVDEVRLIITLISWGDH